MKINDGLGEAAVSPIRNLHTLLRLPQRLGVTLLLLIALAVLSFGYQNSVAAGLTILHSFGDGTVTNDGAYPSAGMIRVNGNFFGVTARQAQTPTASEGSVFEMTPAGAITVIYSFAANSSLNCNSPLLHYQSKLIGVTPFGPGSTGSGTLFALKQSAFTGNWQINFWQQNLSPAGNVILGSDGFFYGVSGAGIGSVYKINPTTHQLSTLYSFSVTSNYAVGPGLVQGNDGNFYGTTNRVAGLQYEWGAVFKLTPTGQATFIQVGGLDGVGPMMKASDGNLYGLGTAFNDIGTEGPAIIYYVTPAGSVGTVHVFGQGTDGYDPAGTLVQDRNGNLYGVTIHGGTAGFGVIFEYSPQNGTYTVLHNFGDGSVPNDGENPLGTLVLGKDRNLYGTTSGGGSARMGTTFKITP